MNESMLEKQCVN